MLSSDTQRPEITNYATMMAVIYSMVKQDYFMQVVIFLWYRCSSRKELIMFPSFDNLWNVAKHVDYCNMFSCDLVSLLQEKIISGLNLNSTSEELESYSLMWSLRPYIDDEVMHQAWRLIHWLSLPVRVFIFSFWSREARATLIICSMTPTLRN